MSNKHSEILFRVASETLETLAFLFSMPSDGEMLSADSGPAASISFSGSPTGRIILLISENTLVQIAANMLGVDEDEEIAVVKQHDALKEFLNVLCGNLLPELADEKETISIGIPEMLSNDELDRWLKEKSVDSKTTLCLDEGQADLYLFIEGNY
ncbi:MAG: chemotaxis protein CheX [Deltaproteobacteria bacterium]|nr:chemotaxis protein CheX [Deltaproteobacteria bacterium]